MIFGSKWALLANIFVSFKFKLIEIMTTILLVDCLTKFEQCIFRYKFNYYELNVDIKYEIALLYMTILLLYPSNFNYK